MAKTKTTPQIEFRLLANDHIRFDEVCRVKGKKRSQSAREAVIWYLDNQEKLTADMRESALEKRLQKMEERLAALQVRTAIDIGMVYMLIFRNMGKETRQDDVAWAYHGSVERLKEKLKDRATEVKELEQIRAD